MTDTEQTTPARKRFDVTKLTLGEVAKVEDLSGLTIGDLADSSKPKGRLLASLAYVINRRSNPAYTLNMAEQIPLDEISDLIDLGQDDDASAEGNGSEPSE